MNSGQRNLWLNEVLDVVFSALASSDELRELLVFKGARVLNRILGHDRESLDLDSSLKARIRGDIAELKETARRLQESVKKALSQYFDRAVPVRFRVGSIKAEQKGVAETHPHGWNGFEVVIRIEDLKLFGIKGMPSLPLEVSAAEELQPSSVMQLPLKENWVWAYTLQRIAGEKLRAFLTSLPEYNHKLKRHRGREAVRVKDLYDLARIHRSELSAIPGFWPSVAAEFALACKSRAVDCAGQMTFRQDWDVTERAYQLDTRFAEIPFSEVDNTLDFVVTRLKEAGVIPSSNPLPGSC